MKKFVFILYVFACILLFLPLWQQITKIPKIKGLRGAVAKSEFPQFSIDTWNSAKYQDSVATYCNQTFGFRSSCVRIHNQILYSFFNEIKARGVIEGKEGYLFERNYIHAYLGKDFLGEDSIQHMMYKLAKIRDTLAHYNCTILPIFAIGKASFYPEYIPDSSGSKQGQTNYEVFKKYMDMYAISYIDFHSYYRKKKNSSQYPIYTKQGIHWTQNTMVEVADSIVGYIQNNYGYSMPRIQIKSREETSILQGSDNDIALGMNLMFYTSDVKVAYPTFTYIKPAHSKLPKVTAIADSYWWGIYNYSIPYTCFDNHQFWFYNHEIYSKSEKTYTKNIDIISHLQNQDVIILLATDATLSRYGWGFIQNVYDLYYSPKK